MPLTQSLAQVVYQLFHLIFDTCVTRCSWAGDIPNRYYKTYYKIYDKTYYKTYYKTY